MDWLNPPTQPLTVGRLSHRRIWPEPPETACPLCAGYGVVFIQKDADHRCEVLCPDCAGEGTRSAAAYHLLLGDSVQGRLDLERWRTWYDTAIKR